MGVNSLAIVGGTPDDTERYKLWLEENLKAISPLLSAHDTWSNDLLNEAVGESWLSETYATLRLNSESPILTAEIKTYLISVVLDNRKAEPAWFRRRIPVIQFLTERGHQLLASAGAASLSDIPHPLFQPRAAGDASKSVQHNEDILTAFTDWYGERYPNRRRTQTREYIRDGQTVVGEYRAPEIQLIGEVHKILIINRALMVPVANQDIILLNHLYSEEDTRFRDRQRRSDAYVSFLDFEAWLRPLMRSFILDKIEHGELASRTVSGMRSRLHLFASFLAEEGVKSPDKVTEELMERYVAWGNRRGSAGKNWYTDIVQLLKRAPTLLPEQWKPISLDPRATKKIKYKQAPDDPRNRLYASREGANRAAPPEALSTMVQLLDELPAPIPAVFMLGISTGARAEDLHAILFDCLEEDPHDSRFMLLTFWQNNVSKWNTKPLLKTDPAHKALIEMIEAQRERVRQKHGGDTKYLFPTSLRKMESFLGHHWTLQELKKLCLKHSIVDDEGRPFDFTWHPLRHHRGTQMAAEGHDILSIMFELGHASPDMATMYVNRRLDLKKKALLHKGGGKFYTIESRVDTAIGDLLVRKETMVATRVCGGACTLPGQLGEWCDKAHACLSCKFFRADSDDVDHFRCERSSLYSAIEGLEHEAKEFEEQGQTRMAEITRKRIQRNKDAAQSTDNIIRSIEQDGEYQGSVIKFKPAVPLQEQLL